MAVHTPGHWLTRLPPTLILMFGSTLWGLTWIWLKAIDQLGMGPITLSIFAYGMQFLMVLPWALHWLIKTWRPNRANHPLPWRWLVPLAFMSGVAGIGFTISMVYGDVVRSMLLFFLIPAWGVLFGHWFLREALTGVRISAVVLALAGAALILGPDVQWGFSFADLAALIAGIALAGSNVLFRYLQDEPMLVKLSVMQVGGVIFGLMFLLILPEPGSRITLAGVAQSALYGGTLLLGAMLATQYAVERIPAGRAAILMTLELLVASASAILIGHEQPTINVWMGGFLILGAALLEARSQPMWSTQVAT